MKNSLFAAMLWACTILCAISAVRVEDVPEKGLQPDVAVASDGTIHLVYLRGDPKASEVRYTWRVPGKPWQPGLTVNSVKGSAIAVGSIRGPGLALGKSGSVHVLWNGNDSPHASLWYARMPGGSRVFEPQRDLRGSTTALDGGASLSVDRNGSVLVAWHGNEGPDHTEENQRLVFLLSSRDDGGNFAPLEIADRSSPGVCACCSLRVFSGRSGGPHIFYRKAAPPDHRAMTLLSLHDGAWSSREIEDWRVAACPMSSAALASWKDRLLGAWETEGKIRAGWISDAPAIPLTAGTHAKHPVLVISGDGKILLAWSEDTGWNRGGKAAWRQLDAELKPISPDGESGGLPAWGKVAAYADQDGEFVILR